jgi:hypothetical protein
MKDNVFNKAKEDGMLVVRTVNLVARISKLKMEIGALVREKDRHYKTMGFTTMEIYRRERAFDGASLCNQLSSAIGALQQIDRDLLSKENEIAQLRTDFKTGGAQPAAKPDQ